MNKKPSKAEEIIGGIIFVILLFALAFAMMSM